MDPQLKATCNQVIFVSRLASVSNSGDPTYGAPVRVMARVEDDEENADSSAGTQRRTRVRIMTEEEIRDTDRIWIRGASPSDASLGRTPLKVQELPDESGAIDHYETVL